MSITESLRNTAEFMAYLSTFPGSVAFSYSLEKPFGVAR